MTAIKILDEIKLDSSLKEKVLDLIIRDEVRLLSLCKRCKTDNFTFINTKNDLVRLAVSILYLCEYTYGEYQRLGISDRVFFDTASDISVWCRNNNNIGLKNIQWIKNHLNCELFRLGRLQFQLYKCNNPTLKYKLLPFEYGENLIYVHIPQGEKLVYSDCLASIRAADNFFEQYFPHYKYQFFFSETWLLYENNWLFMETSSNILQFSTLFEIAYSVEDERQGIERIFGAKERNKSKYTEKTALQRSAKHFMQNGGKLGIGIGFIDRSDI